MLVLKFKSLCSTVNKRPDTIEPCFTEAVFHIGTSLSDQEMPTHEESTMQDFLPFPGTLCTHMAEVADHISSLNYFLVFIYIL